MNGDDARGLSLLTARWLALGAAGGASLALVVEQFGVEGPWQIIALVLALLALFASVTLAFAVRKREQQLQQQEQICLWQVQQFLVNLIIKL